MDTAQGRDIVGGCQVTAQDWWAIAALLVVGIAIAGIIAGIANGWRK